jgi:phosphate transport system substrate-binding protein
MSVWIPAYAQVEPQIAVNYNAEGSGAGIIDFQGQRVDFGESDLPLQSSDIAKLPSGTTALTIPISASAVVPAYNIKLTNGSYCQNGLNFTGSVLAQIFLGNITTWNDPQIQNLNPTVPLPAQTIITVHRSDGSGTMFAFTDYLSQASSTWNTTVGKGKSVAWPNLSGVAIGSKGNAGVAASIAQNVYSIGPLEIAYEIENSGQISYGAVQNAAGSYVLANVTNIQAALQAGGSSLPAGNAVWSNVSIIDSIYNDNTDTGVYPITTLTYALVYQAQSSYTQGAALVNFLSWVVNKGQSFGPSLGYAPLPSNIVAIDNATIKLITYNGTPIQS